MIHDRGRPIARARAVLLAAATCWAAGAPSADAQRLPIARFAAEQGISGSQIWDVHQDRRGLIWIATTWGFARFDGERFDSFSVAEGLASPSGRSILEDPQGGLWFGNNAGVARYDGRSIESFEGRPGAPETTVWDAAVDGAGVLWFGTEHGLSRFERGEFRRFGKADGLASDYVYALLAARDGALWVGSRGDGLARCEPRDGGLGPCRIFRAADGLGAGVVRALAEDGEGRILAGTRGAGVAVWEGGAFRSLRATPGATGGLPSDDVYALLVRANGHLAVGTAEHGLAICLEARPGRCRALGEPNGLPENGVRALAEDREGNLWIGTEGGLGLLAREDLWSYSVAEGLPNRNVYAVAPGGAGEIWLGTFGGLARLVLGPHGEPSVDVLRAADGLPADWVWSLLRDRHGALWVGTEGGLCRLERGRCTTWRAREGLPSSFVLALAEDGEGSLWVGTAEGVGRLRRDARGEVVGVDAFSAEDGLPKARAYAIAADPEGRVWLAQGDRLTLYEGGRFRAIGAAEGFGLRAVRGLGVDRRGRLLVGGWGRVARLESGAGEPLRFRSWERESGLADQMVLTLADDADGRHLLLGTNLGVVALDPEGAGGAGMVVARVDASSGAIATEVAHTAAFAVDGEGRRWFGFKGGATALIGELAPDPAAPAVAFARLESERGRVFLAPFSGLERGPVGWLGGPIPELPSRDNRLRARVRATAYSRRADLRFQFRLEGVDADWSEPRPEPFRDLMNLPPGEHRLLARASRPDGPWGEPASLAFRIDPAWWQEPAFPYLVALALLLLIAAGAAWRARGIRHVRDELERRIAERTDDLARYAAALSEHLQTVDRASERARRAEQARRDLFARASHELRTPLTAVLGFSELLERALGPRLEAKEKRYLANVRESSELLLRQINELLEHLKLESGRIEIHLDEIALDAVVESVASLMEGFALHRGVRLDLRLPPDPPLVRVDVAKLRQVLMNLVSNAVKFSPSGETVAIAVELRPPAATGWAGDGYAIEVSDRGPGIAPAEVETIFEPYRRLAGASTAPGTGLGLPIARQFVELLGGRLEVESEPGRGSTFRVLLPVDPDPTVPLFESADSGAYEPRRTQILVLDRDRERFGALVGELEEEALLAVRVDDAAALARMLGSLRPRAVVVPFDPADPESWWPVAQALRPLREQRLPLVLVPTVGARSLAMPFVGVLETDVEEPEMRRALRAAGVAPRRATRRPLALIAGTREAGVEIGTALGAAGCDHFRVEGAEAVRAALAEARPDVVASDVVHALALAGEVARRAEPGEERAAGWILFEAGAPDRADLESLTERVMAEGDDAERALGPALARILESGAAAV